MKELLNSEQLNQSIKLISDQIVSDLKLRSSSSIALIGIRTRGVPLATRLHMHLQKKIGGDIPTGILDITLYRDDLSQLSEQPLIKKTEIFFSIDDKIIYLVDDVLYTGRTIRAALNALFDYGRPKAVKLVVLVDRGGREVPIQADIVGTKYDGMPGDNVKVKLVEVDGEDGIGVITGI